MLAVAINRDIIGVVAKTDNNVITVHSEGYPDIKPVRTSALNQAFDEQGTTEALIKGIVKKFKDMGYNVGGYNAYITSEVPIYSGLSSSAAIEVLLGQILNGLYNSSKITPLVIAQIGQYSENIYFGKPCGLMDQAASAIGNMIAMDFKDPRKPVIKKESN